MRDPIIIYVLYDHPADYPDEYVICRSLITDSGEEKKDPELYFRNRDLEKCREEMAKLRLYRLARDPNDDPVILESYI